MFETAGNSYKYFSPCAALAAIDALTAVDSNCPCNEAVIFCF